MQPHYRTPEERSKRLWQDLVAYATCIALFLQVIGLFLVYRTLAANNQANIILDKTLTATHVPLLRVELKSVGRSPGAFTGLNVLYTITCESDSFINDLHATWEMNDYAGRTYSLNGNMPHSIKQSKTISGSDFGYHSDDYYSPDGSLPAKSIICLLPRETRIFTAYLGDLDDDRPLEQAFFNGESDFKGTFSYQDMFHHSYTVTVRFHFLHDQYILTDMEMAGYFLQLQK